MAFNKARVLEDIQKYIQRGQIDKAIEEYEKVLRIDPKDYKLRQKLGDLYLRKGKKNEAINQYLNVADVYIKDGFYLKAIAIYRQILRTDPSKLDIYEKLADLYKKQGLIVDAVAQLRSLAEIYEKQKNLSEAISTWEKIISFDPDNILYRGKIVEFYLKQGLASRAAEKLQQSIDYLKSKNRVEDVERLLSHFPGIVEEDKELSLKIAYSLYESGKYKDAIDKLDSLIKQNSKNPDLYSLKGYCYFNLGNTSLSRSCFESAIKLNPNHIEAKKGLAKVFSKEKDFISLIVVIEEIFTILKAEKAYDNLKNILDSYYPYLPEEEKILKLYIELAKEWNNHSLHIEYLKKLGKLYTKNKRYEEADKVYKEILALDTYEESAIKYFEEREIENHKEVLTKVKEEIVETAIEVETKEEADIEREIEEVSFLLKYGLLKNAKEKLDELKLRFPDSPAVKEKWAEYFENTKDYQALKIVYEELINLYKELENEEKTKLFQSKLINLKGKTLPSEEPKESIEEHIIEPIEEPELIEEIEEIEIESFMPNIEDVLLEADFNFKNNKLEEARRLCQKILEIDSGNKRANELLIRIDKKTSEEKKTPEITPEKKEEYFDLTSEIIKELEKEEKIKTPFKDEAERITFETLFKEFKEKLSQQIGKEDLETHYNLGIAYKEMGLYDDAITEFFLTSEFEEKTYDSYIMIASCFVEKGELEKAILFYKKALNIEGITDNNRAGIYFELGNIHEREKDIKKAYICFKKANALDLSLKIAQNKIDDMIKINPELSTLEEIDI